MRHAISTGVLLCIDGPLSVLVLAGFSWVAAHAATELRGAPPDLSAFAEPWLARQLGFERVLTAQVVESDNNDLARASGAGAVVDHGADDGDGNAAPKHGERGDAENSDVHMQKRSRGPVVVVVPLPQEGSSSGVSAVTSRAEAEDRGIGL